MDDEREKSRMKESANDLASLISFLNLGIEEMLIVNMCNWLDRELLMESTTWLVDLPWGGGIHLDSYLNEEPMEGNDVDDQPTPSFLKPMGMPNYYQIL